jgi:hypothetical protein
LSEVNSTSIIKAYETCRDFGALSKQFGVPIPLVREIVKNARFSVKVEIEDFSKLLKDKYARRVDYAIDNLLKKVEDASEGSLTVKEALQALSTLTKIGSMWSTKTTSGGGIDFGKAASEAQDVTEEEEGLDD